MVYKKKKIERSYSTAVTTISPHFCLFSPNPQKHSDKRRIPCALKNHTRKSDARLNVSVNAFSIFYFYNNVHVDAYSKMCFHLHVNVNGHLNEHPNQHPIVKLVWCDGYCWNKIWETQMQIHTLQLNLTV